LSRRLILLNLLLLALCALAGWRLWTHAKQVEFEQDRFLARKVAPADPPVLAPPPPPGQTSPAGYLEVASRLLLSRDRNPVVVIEEKAPVKIMPALPRFHGLFQLSGPPRIVLSERDGAPQKSYAIGDQIGEFTLRAATQAGLVFEWDGKKVGATYAELRSTVEIPAQPAAPARTAQNSAAPAVTAVSTVSAAELKKPGESISESMRYCNPGDTSAEGAVVDGFRKVIRKTPFGNQCYWEKVR
jgi:hypothetical protein